VITLPKPVSTPYVPQTPVSKVLIAGDAPDGIIKKLLSYGVESVKTGSLENLPRGLMYHPDMQFVNICEGLIVYAKGANSQTVKKLNDLGFELIEGDTLLNDEYPYDIAYNCAVVGKYAFLNINHTDKKVLELLEKCRIIPVHTRQGYAKCSTAIINQEAIITADITIHENAVRVGIDSLLIPPQKNIRLRGYDYGFIGGCTGLISETQMAFAGDFNLLNSSEIIGKFLEKHGVKPVSLDNSCIHDIGSIIPLCSV